MTEYELRKKVQLDAGILQDPSWQGSRVTRMLNNGQDWLQGILLDQGSKNWKTEVTIPLSADSLQGTTTASGDVPSDWLSSKPIEGLYPTAIAGGAGVRVRPLKEINIRNFIEVSGNAYLAPSVERGVFVLMDEKIHALPSTLTTVDAVYTRKVTDLVYNNKSITSEIPADQLPILIDRTVAMIQVLNAGEQLTPQKITEIEKTIAQRYQLKQTIEEDKDRQVTQ